MRSPAKAPNRCSFYSDSELRRSQSVATEVTCSKTLWRPPMTVVSDCSFIGHIALPRRSNSKKGSGLNRCPFLELNRGRFLESLDQLKVHEPPEVVVEAARIVVSVTLLEAERLRRIRAQDVGDTNGIGGIVQ
jgi:hypothetical protein